MAITAYTETNGDYKRSVTIHEIDSENLYRAKAIFEDYKQRGVILNDSFDDPVWRLSSQVKNVGLTLLTFEDGYPKKVAGWIGCDYRCYQDCVKAYISFMLGEMGLSALQELSRLFNRIATMNSREAIQSTANINHIAALLQIIPGGCEERDYVIQELEDRQERSTWKSGNCKQRHIEDFKTYLRFHDVLSDFWKIADANQKLFYFPLYFWWNLTTILPLRPMEFLLTPRDCLKTRNSNNILTIRRTRLKGGFQKIGYRIDEDYELKEYAIHDALAHELRAYLDATAKMRATSIGTLFLQEPHYHYFQSGTHFYDGYYSYVSMNTCLRYFYKENIEPKYSDISRIHLGDTRHLAMASLIISGGSPVICRELAGHSNIDISSHYYSNISYLVECATLERYRKTKGKSADLLGTLKYPVSTPKVMRKVGKGYCDAPSTQNGGIDECLKVLGKHGHIGDCACCGHYWPDEQGVRLEFYDEKVGKQQVDADSRYLMQMIELVRKGRGYTESIGSALLRLQRSSYHYGQCLWEKYERMEQP